MWLSVAPVTHMDTVTVDSSGEVINMCSYGRKEHCMAQRFISPTLLHYSLLSPTGFTPSCVSANSCSFSHGELSPAVVSYQSCISCQTHLRLCVLAVTATSIIRLKTSCRTGTISPYLSTLDKHCICDLSLLWDFHVKWQESVFITALHIHSCDKILKASSPNADPTNYYIVQQASVF